jgi:hypothetical protein
LDVIGLAFVVPIFLLMAYLKQRGALTFGRAASLGTVAMFFVLMANGLTSDADLWKVVLSSIAFSLIVGGLIFGLFWIVGTNDDQSSRLD